MLTVITKSGNAYPVGGCRILNVQTSYESYYRLDLLVITPSGTKEYIIESTDSGWGYQRVPKWMADLRDCIVTALKDGAEILDLRESKADPEQTPVTSTK